MNKTHPRKPDVQRQLSYDHNNLSHIVCSTRWEGLRLKGIVETCNTRCGQDFKGRIEQGCQVAFSMRAVGPVVEQKKNYVKVKKPLTLFCYDEVVHPSHAVAYMDKVISESANSGSILIAESSTPLIPISEAEMINFIKDQSKNYKELTEQLLVDTAGVRITLSEDNRFIYVKEAATGDTIGIKVESAILDEFRHYMKKF